MYNLEASALRVGTNIEITVSGMLPSSCWEARIADFYPGGNIHYVIDPGAAQVFVTEELNSGSGYCTLGLVPWVRTVTVPDQGHAKAQIFINGIMSLEVDVVGRYEIATLESDVHQFRVVSLTGSLPDYVGCSVVLADAIVPAIYTTVFGPDTFASCDAWTKENCSALD